MSQLVKVFGLSVCILYSKKKVVANKVITNVVDPSVMIANMVVTKVMIADMVVHVTNVAIAIR